LKRRNALPNVEWRKYLSINNKVLNQYLYNYGDEILLNMLDTLRLALSSNSQSIVLIEFQNTGIVSVVQREDYVKALQQLLILCERMEKYEICAKIVSVQMGIRLTKITSARPKRKQVNLT
jgi:hypothetical protein|tara:strand:+ start:87 stop:449 length:363 start_codon:yes stop_codon:yes gene_type:complete